MERSGGSREPTGELTAACPVLAFDLDGNAVAQFEPGDARVQGEYLVTYTESGVTTIRDIADFSERFSTRGEIVAELNGKLVALTRQALTPGAPLPDAFEPARTQAWLVDPRAKRTTGPCQLPNSNQMLGQRDFYLLAGETRLLVTENAPVTSVTLCSLQPMRVLFQSPLYGSKPWLTDATERTLFLSGSPLPQRHNAGDSSADLPVTETYDHRAIDLHSGVVALARVKEISSLFSEHALSLSADERTLVVASHLQAALFATRPFHWLGSISLAQGAPGLDSSYDLTPEIRLLSDGNTALALFDLSWTTYPAAPEPNVQLSVLSLPQRRVLLRGKLLGEIYAEETSRRTALVVDVAAPEPGIALATIDGQGKLTRRALASDEGVNAGQRLPPEFASLTRVERRSPAAPSAASVIAQRLAPKLCWVGGLFVPRAACPNGR